MRVWPYSVTRVTLKIEITAPAASTVPGHDAPTTFSRIAASPASWPSNSVYGWAATATTATRMYRVVTVTSAIKMASGIVRRVFTSSPAVETASRPM